MTCSVMSIVQEQDTSRNTKIAFEDEGFIQKMPHDEVIGIIQIFFLLHIDILLSFFRDCQKVFVLICYHEIFEKNKPHISADKRGYVKAYMFICGFFQKHIYTHVHDLIINYIITKIQWGRGKVINCCDNS